MSNPEGQCHLEMKRGFTHWPLGWRLSRDYSKSFIHTVVGAGQGAGGDPDPTHGPSKHGEGHKRVGNSVSPPLGCTRGHSNLCVPTGPPTVRAFGTGSESLRIRHCAAKFLEEMPAGCGDGDRDRMTEGGCQRQ